MSDSLTTSVLASQAMLRERIAHTTHVSFPRQPRDLQNRADSFLISACRHVSAVSDVLAGEISRHGDPEQARLVTRECHLLLVSMHTAKARLYGSGNASRTPWGEVWEQVEVHFEALLVLEREAVEDLAGRLPAAELDALSGRMGRAEVHGSTRPHPFLPRRGMPGWMARTVCARTDGIWDNFEGRFAPKASPAAN
ncbi:MAG: hypothetical protein WKF79_13395 [Nocardioides sp.]